MERCRCARYPVDFPWGSNVFFVRHLPPADHPAFYASSPLTLNVTRAAMAGMGYCPSGRLFEAAACGTALLSDTWEGLDHFFEPGREIFPAAGTDEASEVGVSTFGAEEVQEFGLRRTAELLLGRAPRIHWYSLYDLPRAWPATTRHREAEGSSYYRHFYMGILREDGTPKLSLKHFADFTPELGICQWFHFEDPRLDDAVRWLRKLGVKKLRTGLSWADSFRPDADAWFDRQMKALDEFDVTITYCFTPEHRGVQPHHASPPQCLEEYADFCARMTRRYA